MGGGVPAPDLRGERQLVLGVPKREQEADGNGFGVELWHRVELERRELARRADPSPDSDAALERDERRCVLGAGPIQVRARLSAEVEEVLEARRGDERSACAA